MELKKSPALKGLAAATALLVSLSGTAHAAPAPGINLAHLDWLRRPVTLEDGQAVTTWQIYASPERKGDRKGPYRFVGDEDEGIGCIDDVARATLVYLKDYERTRSPRSLETARSALKFIHALATPDGTYYNFVFDDGRINTDGPTSKPGLNWWTARALWATAAGARVFAASDPAFSQLLKRDADRTVALLTKDQARAYGTYRSWGDVRIPAWFVGDAADVTSVVVLGLGDLYATHPSQEVGQLMARYAEAIAAYGLGNGARYPYFAHMPSNAVTNWHAYGAHMLQALALSGRLLGDPALIRAATHEADQFTTHLLISGGPIWGFTPAPQPFPQIAYNLVTQTQGLLELYRATHQPRYGKMAGLMVSWLHGDNPVGQPMYDPETGRIWDGIDATGISFDSGAESTIEGLRTLQDLADYPQFAAYAQAREVRRLGATVLEAEAVVAPAQVARDPGVEFSGKAAATLAPGATLVLKGPAAPGEYLLNPIVLRDKHLPGEAATLRVSAPPLAQDYRPVYPQPEAPWTTLEAGFLPEPYRLGAKQPITVAYSGRQPLKLDGLVAQPSVEYRVFAVGKKRVTLLKSMAAEQQTIRLEGRKAPVTLKPYQSILLDD